MNSLVKTHISSQNSRWLNEGVASSQSSRLSPEAMDEYVKSGEMPQTHPGFMGNALGNHISVVRNQETTTKGLKERYAILCKSDAAPLARHFFDKLKTQRGQRLGDALDAIQANNYRRVATDNRKAIIKTFGEKVLGLPKINPDDIVDVMSHDINTTHGIVTFSQNALIAPRSKYPHVVHFGSPVMPVGIFTNGHPFASSYTKALSPGFQLQDMVSGAPTKINSEDVGCQVFGYHGSENTCFNQLYSSEHHDPEEFSKHVRGDNNSSLGKYLWAPRLVVVKNT